MKDIKLRRSISERKLAKDQKKDWKEKSKSEHFERNGKGKSHQMRVLTALQ